MKQLRKDLNRELMNFHHYLKKLETMEHICHPVIEQSIKTNIKISEIIDRYEKKFEQIEKLIEYFESNEDE